MSTETKIFILPDSRSLAWCEYGSSTSQNPPIFYLHGSPSSRFEGAAYHQLALSLDLRIISPDRPSAGLSSPSPGRTILDCPADLLALAAHLNISKFHIIGSSGGNPYLLACLKVIPRDKLLKAQTVSGVYPLKLGTQGMRFIQRAVMFVSYYIPSVSGALMDWTFGVAARDPEPDKMVKMLAEQIKQLPPSDQEAWKLDDWRVPITDAAREAFRHGGDCAASEFGLWSQDWGFDLQDIDAKCLTIWHGEEDGNCGIASAKSAAALLKGAETRFLAGEGHYVAARHREEILRGFLP